MTRMHALVIAAVCMASMACSTTPKDSEDREDIRQEAEQTLALAKQRDSKFAQAVSNSVGVAVFPKVGKGAAGVGGAYGRGILSPSRPPGRSSRGFSSARISSRPFPARTPQ